jgi:phage replication O-like protein O
MGYTQIDNQYMEQIAKLDLSSAQLRILMFIIRQTAGFHRNSCAVSYTALEKATGACRSTVRIGIKKLIALGLIKEVNSPTFNQAREITLNHQMEGQNQTTDTHSCNNNQKSEQAKNKKVENSAATQKKPMGSFKNVMLSEEEYAALKGKFGQKADKIIDVFSTKLKSKGYKYNDHYATILLWHGQDDLKRADEDEEKKKKELEKGFDTDEFFKVALMRGSG